MAGISAFAEAGYAGVSLEELMRSLGITRGALYHHFKSKRVYFRAVVERLLEDLEKQISAASSRAGDGWEGIEAGCNAFLKAALDPRYRRIVIVDGPAALGWKEWKCLDDKHLTSSLREGLAELRPAALLSVGDVDAVSIALSGAMNELVLWIAHHPQPRVALKRARTTVARLLGSYR